MKRNKKRDKRRRKDGAQAARTASGPLHPPPPQSGPSGPPGDNRQGPPPAEAASELSARIRAGMAPGDLKPALEAAKALHKQSPTTESEALLVDVYLARIGQLLEANQTADARELAHMVEQRYPGARARMTEVHIRLDACEGRYDGILGALADPSLPPDRKRRLENELRRELRDPALLSRSPILPADHPLRAGARVLVDAMDRVTRGPVDDRTLLLPEIPRQSPLAPWKSLVRAIACFYRREDEDARRFLDAVGPDAAPAPAARALRTLMDGADESSLDPRERALLSAVRGSRDDLRLALESLERGLREDTGQRRLVAMIQRAVRECERTEPELLERLKQHISIRCVFQDVPVDAVSRGIGGPAMHNAYFWRLYARGAEISGNWVQACSLWEEFRRNAVNEQWFDEQGPESAALYLHMIHLLKQLPEKHLTQVQRGWQSLPIDYRAYYRNQPETVQRAAPPQRRDPSTPYFFFPDRLFERAAACEKTSQVFQEWFAFVRKAHTRLKGADEVALSWHEAFPDDRRPLLHLVESAEERNAFTKALRYLERAEALNPHHPEVKRARVRLLILKTQGHLRERKPHLAKKDIAAIESLPQAAENHRGAYLAALSWALHAQKTGAKEASDRLFEEVGRRTGRGAPAAAMICVNVSMACDMDAGARSLLCRQAAAQATIPELLQGVLLGCSLGEDLGLGLEIPGTWEPVLIQGLSEGNGSADPAGLKAVAEAALRQGRDRLAFAASGAGLRSGGPARARFLYLRARSLPPSSRRQRCLTVAAELARRQGDKGLMNEVLEVRRAGERPGRFFEETRNFSGEQGFVGQEDELVETLRREETETAYPLLLEDDDPEDMEGPAAEECDCPDCRRRRARASRAGRAAAAPQLPLFPDGWEEDAFADEDGEDDRDDFPGQDLPPPSLSPRKLDLLEAIRKRFGGRPPTPEELEALEEEAPDLYAELMALVMESMTGKTVPRPDFFPADLNPFAGFGPPGRGGGRGRRKRRTKNKRKRR